MSGLKRLGRLFRWLPVAAVAAWVGYAALSARGEGQGAPTGSAPATRVAPAPAPASASASASASSTAPTTALAGMSAAAAVSHVDLGPDVVVLKELVDRYEPVPFNHKGHAQMAEMWDGCVTCHHRSPDPTTRPGVMPVDTHTQEQAETVPACKSCHEVKSEVADIRMPGLKGAYHRQCLSCHKEWMHENACGACHTPRDKGGGVAAAAARVPTPDDIIGRMHPPIPEPDTVVYRARYTPAAGPNAVFRHKEHTKRFGISCATCHRRDNCSQCHDARPGGNGGAGAGAGAVAAAPVGPRPVRPGKTWRESHAPCVTCHEKDRCAHCHYEDGQPTPPPFDHAVTGQLLDKDHAAIKCVKCHGQATAKAEPTCGDALCHKPAKGPISFPAWRPGAVVEKPPAGVAAAGREKPATAPTTRATIRKIRG